ncbi:hypothetical protein [Anabaena sp. CCY 0017]|uniref:hypothetical protein n=1 Tax=Anabaena sp. CCY 0017 TaxID=3103866 RepID=UPI0039C6194C
MNKKKSNLNQQQKNWHISLPKLHDKQLNQVTGAANIKQLGLAIHSYNVSGNSNAIAMETITLNCE